MSKRWLRFSEGNSAGFGILEGENIRVCQGDMFSGATPTDRMLPLASVRLLMPVRPTKVIAMWNNFHALGQKLNLAVPAEPLYLIKAPNSYLDPDGVILKPPCNGKVVFEGELGIGLPILSVGVGFQGVHMALFSKAGWPAAAVALNHKAESRRPSA